MNDLKLYFLRLRNSQRKRDKGLVRKTLNYSDVKKVGILFQVLNENMHGYVNQLIKDLKADGKEVQAFTFFARDSDNPYDFKYSFFSFKDISLFGGINSQAVNDFIDTEFDYLYCVSNNNLDVFETILAKSKAKCRIGKYFPGLGDIFEFMVKIDDTDELNVLIEQMILYTKAINKNARVFV